MANTPYENFVLANVIEDQFASYLDLQQFATVNNELVGTPGMKFVVNTYSATDGVQKVTKGNGNTQSITAGYADDDYTILTAQGRFEYYDEEEMTDPIMVQTGINHIATDMFNTVNADIFAEFNKADSAHTILNASFNFGDFVDAAATIDTLENLDAMSIFAFVHPKDMAAIRKALKDDLKYVESFSRTGYVGTVAGINLYTKKNAVQGTIVGGTKEGVTIFNKLGTEVEAYLKGNRSAADANVRKNTIIGRKYYVAAITDATKVFKITTSAS